MKFGIGAKLVLMATVLVCVTSLGLLMFMGNKSEDLVLDHEVLDLGDETELRAREMMSEIYALRADVTALAKHLTSEKARALDKKTLCDYCANNFYRKNYVHMEIVWLDPSNEEPWVVQPSSRTPPESIGGRGEFVERVNSASQSEKSSQDKIVLSPFQRVDVTWGCPEETQDGEEAEKPKRINLVWAGQRLLPSGPGGREALVIVALDLDRRLPRPIVDPNDDDRSPLAQANESPRHLAVLANAPENGKFAERDLVFPYEKPNDKPDYVLPKEELIQQFQALLKERDRSAAKLEEIKPLQDPRDILNLRNDRVVPLQRTMWFLQSEPIDVANAGDEEKAAKYLAVADRVVVELSKEKGSNERIGRLLGGVKNFRLLADSSDGVLALKDKVDRKYREKTSDMPSARVAWQRKTQCNNCYIQYVMFPVRCNEGVRYYGLAQAAFQQEMAADVENALWNLVLPGIFIVLGAAAVTFAFSLFITRPLKQITDAAEGVAEIDVGEDPAESGWRRSVSSIVDNLPASRRDEIGVLARAFRQMLDEIVTGHERLRQLNAGLDGLVKERTAELQETNQALEAKIQELVEARNAQARFVASISHDLKTPLTTIKGYCELLLESELTEEQRADQVTIYFARERLQRLIEDIIDSQRIDLGQLKMEFDEFEVAPLLREVGRSMNPAAERNGNTLELEIADGIPTMHSDREKFARVVTNLLSNACKFTQNGTVSLRVSYMGKETEPWLHVEIADTGRGIEPEFQNRIFTPFPQILDKGENPEGTGLGLSNCRGYCQAMGGSIRFESTPGEGTTFTAELPLRADVVLGGPACPTEALTPRPERGATGKPLGPPAVLVVDDEAEVRVLLKRFLEKLGFVAETAENGAEGIRLAIEHKPALITLDVMMADGDGWTVLKELKSEEGTRDIPVVMISVLDDKYKGYALGASDYVTKPIDWNRLARTLNRFRRHENDGHILVVDDDPDLRALASRQLEPLGWSVVEAANGREALDKLSEGHPDIILLDLLMPEMDGFELLQHLRCREDLQSIPVLVVTAKDLTQEDRDRLNGRVLQVLQKEAMDWDELEREIRRVLSPQGLIDGNASKR